MTSVSALPLKKDAPVSAMRQQQQQQQQQPSSTIPIKQRPHESTLKQKYHVPKLSTKQQQPKRQRPISDQHPTMKPSNFHQRSLPPASVNFITTMSDFPPLLSSKATTTTTSTATTTTIPILSLPPGRPYNSNNNHNNNNNHNHVNTTMSSPRTTTITPKFLLKKLPNDRVVGTDHLHSSILQPTAREFHPPPSLSSSSSSLSTDIPIRTTSINTTVSSSSLPPPPTTATATTTTATTTTTTTTTTTSRTRINGDFPPLSVNTAAPPPRKKNGTIQRTVITPKHQVPPTPSTLTPPSEKVKKKLNKESVVLSLSTQKNDTKKKVELPKSITTKLNVTDRMKESTDTKCTDQIDESGAQFDLLRLYQNIKIGIPQQPLSTTTSNNHGGQFIQRITPKKKKFSSLKKKVLEERLRLWQTANGIVPENEVTDQQSLESLSESKATSTTVCLYGFADEIGQDDDDDDEYNELIENLYDMALKIGNVRRVFIPRTYTIETLNDTTTATNWPAFVEFGHHSSSNHNDKVTLNDNNEMIATTATTATAAAKAAVQCWNTLVLGGQTLSCRLLPIEQSRREHMEHDINEDDDDDTILWQNHCLTAATKFSEHVVPSSTEAIVKTSNHSQVLLKHILTDDDLNDEDCLEESLNDIRTVASKYGEVTSIVAVRTDDNQLSTNVIVTYSCDASHAVEELNKVIFGGRSVIATLTSPPTMSNFTVKIRNLITEDDLEDESCLEESLNDVKELATQYGQVQNITVDPPDDTSKLSNCNEYTIHVCFSTKNEAQVATKGFDGMLIGGQTVTATMDASIIDSIASSNENLSSKKCNSEPKPLYSGDKLISERFAECKRVPKIVNQSATPRPYAKLVDDESIKPTIIEMLSELMRLQKRAMEENNTKAKRRLVMGLREVARGIRSHKVKLVIMANNLDEYGVIDKTVQDIVDLAKTEEVPIYYELNKKGLGKAVGKSIKIAVVGIQSADGAHQQYKKLMKYATKNF